jgi:hypothetical protein
VYSDGKQIAFGMGDGKEQEGEIKGMRSFWSDGHAHSLSVVIASQCKDMAKIHYLLYANYTLVNLFLKIQ